ncbi:phage head-tail connector protein [Eubacterium limosum]|uniref:Phage gp6-like head-tail connector protein n=1 Tax=Eubacterium limosum TaxID=1736 RepID=A0AAC9QST1_EUBLI|nr:phage head-tail connector protein [Eubacterium limosum]ARD65002.1 hypothetical protein B2M23_05355 [Eubacterium limosum]PWW52971.1 gp6-like head-tail connector protein [Eubacterium limosum]UQZ20975.1 phage head-tail connector protein [Eubacterium limosum]
MEERLLLELSHYPGFGDLDEPLQKCLIEDAIAEVKSYVNCPAKTELPMEMKAVVKEIALIRFNKMGAEGIAATSQSGVSENYIEDLPAGLRRQLRRIRKLPR